MEALTTTKDKQATGLEQASRKTASFFRQLVGKQGAAAVSTDDPLSASIDARITRVSKETHDSKSYFFSTSESLEHRHAGSHTHIQFDLNGQTINRTYTLSSTPSLGFDEKQNNEYAITVKCVPNGLASNWLFSKLKIGDKLKVSRAQGQFILPYHPPGKILFLSAGSGVTPLMSMLRYLSKSGNRSDIHFLNYSKSSADIIFQNELKQLTNSRSNITSNFVLEAAEKGKEQGRINAKQLQSVVPDLADRDIYMCGPQAFMKASMQIFEQLGISPSRIHLENFTTNIGAASNLGYSTSLHFSSLEKPLISSPSKTILQEAEAAGLQPKSACRTGICRTCRCKKISGTTVNLATGEESSKDNDYILPCVSVAKTETQIEL